MKFSKIFTIIFLFVIIAGFALAQAQSNPDVDPEALIGHILQVDNEQRQIIKDLTLDAVFTEGDRDRDSLIVKARFEKKVYVKYTIDTTWFFEEYLEYYKEGEKQSDQDLVEAAKEKKEKKRKRKSMDISYSMLNPFKPDHRQFYQIEYKGIADDLIEGNVCHHFRVETIEKDETRVNGDYYFEAEGFHLVRVEFTPSKRASNLMFKMKKLDMSLSYKSHPEGYWYPSEFNIDGKGKIGFLFGISFAAREIYSNPVINSGLADEIFQEEK